MREIVLHAFATEADAWNAFRERSRHLNVYELSRTACLSVQSPLRQELFRKVACRSDWKKLTGLPLRRVHWNFAPTQELREAVDLFVRSPLYA